MADCTLPGRIHDWKAWTFGTPPGINEDFGNQWWWTYPLGEFAATLTAGGKPQLDTVGGATGTPVASAATVAEWWNSPQNKEYTITLPETAPGVWKLGHVDSINEFLPIEGELYGNQTSAHNYFWAWESNELGFVYQPGQYLIWFAHNDSLVYINGQKVLHRKWSDGDLVSVARVDLDTLGLTPGQTYPLKLFIASRESATRVYFETNTPIQEEYMVALSHYITGNGTVTPAAGGTAVGTYILTATPATGSRLKTLTVDGVATASGSSLNISTHTLIAAVFEVVPAPAGETRLEILHRVFRILGVTQEGQTPSSAQLAAGREALSGYIKALREKGVKLWTEEWAQQDFATASSSVIGSDGNSYRCIKAHTATADDAPITGKNWTTYWVLTGTAATAAHVVGTAYTCNAEFTDTDADAIGQAFIRQVDGTDSHVDILEMTDWGKVREKGEDGLPEALWHSKTLSPAIRVWPAPDRTDYVLHYRRIRYLDDFTSDSLVGDWPPSWVDAIVFGLAHRLSFEYGLPVQEREELRNTAAEFEAIARGYNHERPTHNRVRPCF